MRLEKQKAVRFTDLGTAVKTKKYTLYSTLELNARKNIKLVIKVNYVKRQGEVSLPCDLLSCVKNPPLVMNF